MCISLLLSLSVAYMALGPVYLLFGFEVHVDVSACLQTNHVSVLHVICLCARVQHQLLFCFWFCSRTLFDHLYLCPCALLVLFAHTTVQLCLPLYTALFDTLQ